MTVFNLQSDIMLLVLLALIAVKIFALVSSTLWADEAYQAAGKLTKTTWVAILGLGLVCQLILPITLINLVFTVAALVYLADVRPALASLYRR